MEKEGEEKEKEEKTDIHQTCKHVNQREESKLKLSGSGGPLVTRSPWSYPNTASLKTTVLNGALGCVDL